MDKPRDGAAANYKVIDGTWVHYVNRSEHFLRSRRAWWLKTFVPSDLEVSRVAVADLENSITYFADKEVFQQYASLIRTRKFGWVVAMAECYWHSVPTPQNIYKQMRMF